MKIKQNSEMINSYRDLYDFVKNMKNEYNFDNDTMDLIDMLIYRWFSQRGVRGLDSCYLIFNKKIKENNGFKVRIENEQIKAEWEN